MTDSDRTGFIVASLFGITGALVAIGVDTSRMAENSKRVADTADIEMCLEAVRVGIEPSTLPAPCRALRKEPGL
jgi:hypothetical protein